jgi:hypothetical protein
MASARFICQADPLAGYKAVVPRRFSINSLHPFSPSSFQRCLVPQASCELHFPPRPSPAGPRPHRKIRRSQVRRMPPRDCWLLFARGIGSTLSSTPWLWVSPRARMIFGSTLDGPATRNTAGSGRGAWETQHCEPLGAALLAGCLGFQTTEKTMVGCL